MSELHEHRLFQLDQVLSLDEVGNHPGSGCGAADNSTILSCVMTSCGKVGVAAISHPSETAAAANSPFFSPPPLVVFSFVPEFKVHWCNWYSEPSLRPVTLTLSTNDDLLLIGCHGGALCAIPFKLFTDTSNVIGSKKVKVVKTSVEAEASRRSRPTSINWWATHEAKALAIVGTQSGHVLLVDLVDGKEVDHFYCCFTFLSSFYRLKFCFSDRLRQTVRKAYSQAGTNVGRRSRLQLPVHHGFEGEAMATTHRAEDDRFHLVWCQRGRQPPQDSNPGEGCQQRSERRRRSEQR